MSGRRANGEGSIRLRQDGRWEGIARVTLTDGRRKRVSVLGKTQKETVGKLRVLIADEQNGIRRPTQSYTVGTWLDAWLESISSTAIRPRTRELYESTIRLHLKPRLGHIKLTDLRPLTLQAAINTAVEEGRSARHILLLRQVLSSALSEAERQELVVRNVARTIKIPSYRPAEKTAWDADEAARFLSVARPHPHYGAFVLALTGGLRLGEVLGLQWSDVDLEDRTITLRHQLQRVRGAGLQLVPLKTVNSQRTIPLSDTAATELNVLARRRAGSASFVFVSTTGGPLDPKNFAERTFKGLCGLAGVPTITFHEQRHTAATLYKDIGNANPRDAQKILGHAQITTTMQIYQHSNVKQRRDVINRVDAALNARSQK
ncbi:tyrosine-type recombinase/integrase [Mycobacteroides abscessus]|uniref:tyrosine-type recombinase/integrase n=1 Tax=Mycobacteroides abscessus TaxID=36809 RepID=UPI002102CBF3|nr:site-specific integrase [Mycobacteroides abscessus]